MAWFWSRKPPEDGGEGYRIFTAAFDQVTTGKALSEALKPGAKSAWEADILRYNQAIEPQRQHANLHCLDALQAVSSAGGISAGDWAVSVLVDHSGSLRGSRAILACFVMQSLGDFLSRLGVAYEILGFTTASWRGGEARRLWRNTSRKANPGRLNDILHIVYREFADTSPGAPYGVHHILRPDLLKENIDGEAVAWAVDRLEATGRRHQLLLVISDGAPVDDSTLTENPPDYLMAHLKSVVAEACAQPEFKVAGVGIDHDLTSIYPDSTVISTLEEAALRPINLLRCCLLPAASAES